MANKNQIKKIAIGASLMTAAGYIAGVLNAPKSGKKTRQELKDTLNGAEDRLVLLHSEISELINIAAEEFKDKSLNAHDSKKYKLTLELAKDIKSKLDIIIQTIKKQEKSTDTDLRIAIKEAERAIRHLKDFILKK
jgi:gas vesicle protein